MSASRTVTVPTLDAGDVTLPEPSWCFGHSHHDPRTARVDLVHVSPIKLLTVDDWRLGVAFLYHAPYGGQEPRAAVHLDFESGRMGLTPEDLRSVAATMERSADYVRALADQLDAILAGGAR